MKEKVKKSEDTTRENIIKSKKRPQRDKKRREKRNEIFNYGRKVKKKLQVERLKTQEV
jgi:hypothetical protein